VAVGHQGASGRVLGKPAGRTYLLLFSLTVHVRGLLTVAGDELRKDGGNEANRVPRADCTEQPKGRAPNLEIRCAVNR